MELKSLLVETHAHMPPLSILEGLSAEAADRRPRGAPHSVAEVVAHLAYWQEWFCARCRGSDEALPSRARDGWPPVETGSWLALVERFSAGLETALSLADEAAGLDRPLEPAVDLLDGYTVRDALIHVAQHNAHHLGQVVLLRQMLEAWPPPSGSFTW